MNYHRPMYIIDDIMHIIDDIYIHIYKHESRIWIVSILQEWSLQMIRQNYEKCEYCIVNDDRCCVYQFDTVTSDEIMWNDLTDRTTHLTQNELCSCRHLYRLLATASGHRLFLKVLLWLIIYNTNVSYSSSEYRSLIYINILPYQCFVTDNR